MGKYSPRAVTEEEYVKFVETIRAGFIGKDGVKHKPNDPVAFALILKANLGISVKPQIISGDFRRLYKVEIPVTVCG